MHPSTGDALTLTLTLTLSPNPNPNPSPSPNPNPHLGELRHGGRLEGVEAQVEYLLPLAQLLEQTAERLPALRRGARRRRGADEHELRRLKPVAQVDDVRLDRRRP